MGNIKDKPKAPSPQVIYVPQPVYADAPADDIPDGAPAPTVEEAREKSLLSRNRSRLGTILTGFRGLLAPVETDTQRKTLLGE